MTRDEVWTLLEAGCNAAEIAAAARVSEEVARCMADEAMGRTRGATLRAADRKRLMLNSQVERAT